MSDYNFPKSSEKWNNEDYYNHYLLTKRFGFVFIKDFKKNKYDTLKEDALFYENLYFLIYNILPEKLKDELYLNFNQQLKALIKIQTFDINKSVFKKLKKKIKQPQQKETKKPDERYKDELLFKVGLLFASGKMEKYYSINNKNKTIFKDKYTAPKIANEIGFSNYNKYILATINNYSKEKSNGNKNIFNSLDKMTKIIEHCKENDIEVTPYFLERLTTEQNQH